MMAGPRDPPRVSPTAPTIECGAAYRSSNVSKPYAGEMKSALSYAAEGAGAAHPAAALFPPPDSHAYSELALQSLASYAAIIENASGLSIASVKDLFNAWQVTSRRVAACWNAAITRFERLLLFIPKREEDSEYRCCVRRRQHIAQRRAVTRTQKQQTTDVTSTILEASLAKEPPIATPNQAKAISNKAFVASPRRFNARGVAPCGSSTAAEGEEVSVSRSLRPHTSHGGESLQATGTRTAQTTGGGPDCSSFQPVHVDKCSDCADQVADQGAGHSNRRVDRGKKGAVRFEVLSDTQFNAIDRKPLCDNVCFEAPNNIGSDLYNVSDRWRSNSLCLEATNSSDSRLENVVESSLCLPPPYGSSNVISKVALTGEETTSFEPAACEKMPNTFDWLGALQCFDDGVMPQESVAWVLQTQGWQLRASLVDERLLQIPQPGQPHSQRHQSQQHQPHSHPQQHQPQQHHSQQHQSQRQYSYQQAELQEQDEEALDRGHLLRRPGHTTETPFRIKDVPFKTSNAPFFVDEYDEDVGRDIRRTTAAVTHINQRRAILNPPSDVSPHDFRNVALTAAQQRTVETPFMQSSPFSTSSFSKEAPLLHVATHRDAATAETGNNASMASAGAAMVAAESDEDWCFAANPPSESGVLGTGLPRQSVPTTDELFRPDRAAAMRAMDRNHARTCLRAIAGALINDPPATERSRSAESCSHVLCMMADVEGSLTLMQQQQVDCLRRLYSRLQHELLKGFLSKTQQMFPPVQSYDSDSICEIFSWCAVYGSSCPLHSVGVEKYFPTTEEKISRATNMQPQNVRTPVSGARVLVGREQKRKAALGPAASHAEQVHRATAATETRVADAVLRKDLLLALPVICEALLQNTCSQCASQIDMKKNEYLQATSAAVAAEVTEAGVQSLLWETDNAVAPVDFPLPSEDVVNLSRTIADRVPPDERLHNGSRAADPLQQSLTISGSPSVSEETSFDRTGTVSSVCYDDHRAAQVSGGDNAAAGARVSSHCCVNAISSGSTEGIAATPEAASLPFPPTPRSTKKATHNCCQSETGIQSSDAKVKSGCTQKEIFVLRRTVLQQVSLAAAEILQSCGKLLWLLQDADLAIQEAFYSDNALDYTGGGDRRGSCMGKTGEVLSQRSSALTPFLEPIDLPSAAAALGAINRLQGACRQKT